jgi:hypothetical protein
MPAVKSPRDRQIARTGAIALVLTMLPGGQAATADTFDPPTFQTGLWHFERTVSQSGVSAIFNDATFAVRRQFARCVDPSVAMKLVFNSPSVGSCRPSNPIKVANNYVFSLRCDFLGPVRTLIQVESATAYVEINEFIASKPLRTETIHARRIGDCPEAERAALHR